MAALREAADNAMRAYPSSRIAVLSDYDFVYELRGKDSPSTDGHGGLLETSRVMAIAPETVGPDRPVVENHRSPFLPGSPTDVEWPESVVGDTRPASAELGRRVQEHVLRRLDETVRALLPP
jgi:creatinine amidohydrolase